MNDLDTRLRHMAREEETPVPKDFDENLTRTLAQLPARKRRRVPRAVLLAACLVITLPLEFVLGARVYRRPRRLTLAVLPVLVVFYLWDAIAIARGR